MAIRTGQLRELAEAVSTTASTGVAYAEYRKAVNAFTVASSPATIIALCELVEQMGEALEHYECWIKPGHEHANKATEALAALERFQKGE